MAKTDAVTFVLVPAGATEWDAAGRVTGSADLPLCSEGRAQVGRAADGLAPLNVSLVLHAGDDASIETARLIGTATGGKCRMVEDLAEISLGLWEGLGGDEFAEKYPTASRQWQDDPASVVPPEGESLASADERIVATLARALDRAKTSGAIAVVLRPVAIGLVRCWLQGLPASRVWEAAGTGTGGVELHTLPRGALRDVRSRTNA